MYDVVIIGAGPAGLMAAKCLPNSFSFLVIDSKKEIGLPMKCGEGIREKEFVSLFGNTHYSFVRNIVHEHEIMYKDVVKRSFKVDYLQLDRPKFEKWLADGFKDKIKLGTKCKDVIIEKDFARIVVDRGEIKAKLVILTCGSNFNIQRKYKLIKKKPVLLVCYGGIYKNHKLDANKFYAYYDDKYQGYLWIFPKNKDSANVGFGSVKGVNVKAALIELLGDVCPSIKETFSYGGVVPCSGPIERTYYDRLLVCGDAAGMVYAGTGEGIYFALESGRIASCVASLALQKGQFDSGFLKIYEDRWKRSFGKLMKAGIVFYDLQYLAFKLGKVKSLFTRPTNKELKMLIIDGEVPFRAKVVWAAYRFLRKIF